MNNSILLRLMLAMLAIVFAFPSTAADSKPRKPPRGTITRLIDGDSNLVVRIEEHPGGHPKLPQSWPGQNPPAECAGRMDGYTVS
jgi:hypothetical protein